MDTLALGTKKGIDVNDQCEKIGLNQNKDTLKCTDEGTGNTLEAAEVLNEEDSVTICYDDVEVYLDELDEYNIKVGEDVAKKSRYYSDVDTKIPTSVKFGGNFTNVPREISTNPDTRSLHDGHMVNLQCNMGRIPLKIPLKKAFLKKFLKKK